MARGITGNTTNWLKFWATGLWYVTKATVGAFRIQRTAAQMSGESLVRPPSRQQGSIGWRPFRAETVARAVDPELEAWFSGG